MGSAIDDPKRRGHDIHLAIADENVPIAAETPDALVFVNVLVVGVQEAPVANDKIKHGIRISIGDLRIAAKDVVDRSAVMQAGRDLAIAVKRCVASRVGKPLEFIAVGRGNHPEVRVRVPPAHFIVLSDLVEPSLEPVLEMELLIRCTDALNEHIVANCLNAVGKN